jgi:hypothetical protein
MTNDPTIRRLLLELASALPDEDATNQVTGLGVRRGWGGIVNVEVRTSVRPSSQWETGVAMRAAVRRALDGQRHELTFVWDVGSAASP